MIVFQNKYGVYISFDTDVQGDCENSILNVWNHLNPNSDSHPPDYSICPDEIFYHQQLWDTLVDPCRPFQKTPESKNNGDESYILQFLNFCVAEKAPIFAEKIKWEEYRELYGKFWSKKKQFLDFFKIPPKSKWEAAKERADKKIKIESGIRKIKAKRVAKGKRDEEVRKKRLGRL
jgi:hypothetical protein